MDIEYLNKLEVELDRAEIVDPKEIPENVITMRSKVRLKDLVTGQAEYIFIGVSNGGRL